MTFAKIAAKAAALHHEPEMERYFCKEDVTQYKCVLMYGVAKIAIKGQVKQFKEESIERVLNAAAAVIMAEGYFLAKYGKIAHVVADPSQSCHEVFKQAVGRIKESQEVLQKASLRTGLIASWEAVKMPQTP